MRIVAIVQARMASTRLPGKVLKTLAGKPMLWHVLTRARGAKSVDAVVLATTTRPEDRALEKVAAECGVPVHFGDENDVLDRYYGAATKHKADVVVRVTADCPMIDPAVIDDCVKLYKAGGCDYASNAIRRSYPDGLDVEVFSFSALKRAWKQAALKSEREHVTPFIWKQPKLFKLVHLVGAEDRSQLRWCVDNQEDFAFAVRVYDKLYTPKKPFATADVLRLLKREPALGALNAGIECNEGYQKSLREDSPMTTAAAAPAAPKLKRSLELLEQARRLIPGLSQTFSKAPNQFTQGVTPVFIDRAQGSRFWDVDGNEYLDYPLALGPIILGHNDPDVKAAVQEQLGKGTIFSLPHSLEVEVSKLITEVVPCAEMVRFAKNGSDATTAAVRLSRAFTGRDKVACCGYHGWQDWYIGTTTRKLGVPEAVQKLTLTFDYNDLDSLERLFKQNKGEIACVVLEPIGVVEPKSGFLEGVAKLARKHGAILVFDEVVTGFRLALGGAQEYYGVTPDLACFAKAMANGYPISAVTGRRDIMKVCEDIFFSSTFGGEALSLAAAKATIEKLKRKGSIPHLWKQGQKLKDALNASARRHGLAKRVQCIGLAPHTVVTFLDEKGKPSLEMRGLFQQELIKRGILFLVGFNICLAHSDADVAQTICALDEAMAALAAGRPLEGRPPEAVFRKA